MDIASKRLSKLNYDSVKQIICSNPYHRNRSEEKALLPVAVKQVWNNLEPLIESCNRFNPNMTASVQNLKQSTEALSVMVEPVSNAVQKSSPERKTGQEEEILYVRNAKTKPWVSPQPSGMKRRNSP